MEEEIILINQIVANAIIHGGDWGGPYNVNTLGLVIAMNNWLKAKGLTATHHVVGGMYLQGLTKELTYSEDMKYEKAGYFPVLKIAPITEKGIYEGPYDLDLIP